VAIQQSQTSLRLKRRNYLYDNDGRFTTGGYFSYHVLMTIMTDLGKFFGGVLEYVSLDQPRLNKSKIGLSGVCSVNSCP
jgi:hypothetical protein